MDISSTSRSFTNSVRSIKRIYVWENGDCNGNGHVLVINPKLYRSWNGVLSLITNTIRPSFGIVRTLIHLDSKETVRSFEALVPNGKYVALGTEKLKLFKDGYKTLKEKQGTTLPTPIKPQRPGTVRVVIFVLANGKTRETPCKVIITDFDMQAWKLVLQAIARKLDIPTGIRYLTNVDGEAVLDPSSLENGLIYVAVPYNEDFSHLDYNNIFKSLLPMREVDLKDLNTFTEIHGVINDPIVMQAGCHNTVIKSKSEGFNLNTKKTITSGNFSGQKRDCHTLTERPKSTNRAISIQSLLEEAFMVDLRDLPEKDTFPSETKSKSCGCSKANKAVTAGRKQEFNYHCHPNSCQLQCVVCVKDASCITEKVPNDKNISSKSKVTNRSSLSSQNSKSLSGNFAAIQTNEDAISKTSKRIGCSSNQKGKTHEETAIKTTYKENSSFSEKSKYLPGNFTANHQTNEDTISKTSRSSCSSSQKGENSKPGNYQAMNGDSISKISKQSLRKTHEEVISKSSSPVNLTRTKSPCTNCNNVKNRKTSVNSSNKSIYSTSFSETKKPTLTKTTTKEISKSLPELTPPQTVKLCYCQSCQTEPKPCAPGQCTMEKAQLTRLTQQPPKSSPKVQSSAQTSKKSKSSCCKWLKSTFRTSRSSGTSPVPKPNCTSKGTGSGTLQNECLCAAKGCCNPELCSGQSSGKPQPVMVEEKGCTTGNKELFEGFFEEPEKNPRNPDKSDNFCYPNTCQLIGYKSVSTEASCPTSTKGDGALPNSSASDVTSNSMSRENQSNGKTSRIALPHTAKFCKLEPPEEIECVVRPGQVVFRRFSPQVELLYQKPLEQPDDEDDDSVTPVSSSEPTIKEEESEVYEKGSGSGEELNQIHMSLKEFIEDVIDTSVYLIDQFEMVPKEKFDFPMRQAPVTIPLGAKEVIDDIITKSSLTIQLDEPPAETVTSEPIPVEQTLAVPPKCSELDHTGCCPCLAGITTSKDVVEFASQYDPHYTRSLIQGPDVSIDNLEEDFSTEKLPSDIPRTSILRSSAVSSPYSISGNKQRVSIKIPGEKKLLYSYTDSRSDIGLRNDQTSSEGDGSVFLPENMIFEQFRSEPNSTAQSTMTMVPAPKTVETQTPKCYCKEPMCTCKFECFGRTLAVSEESKDLKLSDITVVSNESLTGMLVGENSCSYNGPASIEAAIGGPSSSIIDSHLRLFDFPNSKSNQSGSMFCIRSKDEINKSV